MKKLLLISTFILFIISCEKDRFVPNSEIPDWLKDKITIYEESLKSDPKSLCGITAWLRFKYEGNYYFEYDNPILSSGRPTYKYDGSNFDSQSSSEYQTKKCCKKYVWAGPSYPMD